MRVLFIDHTLETYANDNEPLGIMMLSAVLKAAGHQCVYVAPEMPRIERAMEEFKPQVAAYSVTTCYHDFYLKLNEELRRRWDVFSVFGGPHPTFHPDYMEQSPVMDAICRGEGEAALVELVNKLEAGDDHTGVENFYVRTPAGIIRNPVRPLNENLDALPFPDRELIYSAQPLARLNRIKVAMTLRGCPYRCTNCFNHAYNRLYRGKGRVLRRRSVDNVIAEVNSLKARYPLDMIHFIDDTFTLMPEWLEEFFDKYPRQCGIRFVMHARLDVVTAPMAAGLKAAGCVTACAGVEAGDPRVRNEILKRGMDNEAIIKGTQTLMDHGIRVLSLNMLGIPGGGLDSDMMTYELNRKSRPTFAKAVAFLPYPGTESSDYAVELGIFDGSLRHLGPSAYCCGESILKLDRPREVANLVRLLGVGVWLNIPARIMRILIALPLKPLYILLQLLHKGYGGMKTFPAKHEIREVAWLLKRLFKIHSHDTGPIARQRRAADKAHCHKTIAKPVDTHIT